MMRTRIAPTPSGYLHLGNLYSFVLTWLIAKRQRGVVFLRIDDLDAARVRTEYLENIFQTLDFIGLQPDEGPSGVAEFLEKFSQHLRLDAYNVKKKMLIKGNAIYACACSRKQLESGDEGRIYPGNCREKALPLDMPGLALRLKMHPETEISLREENGGGIKRIELGKEMGEFIVWRKDGLPSYQLASVVDDEYFGINYVVRGEDLLNSTASQLYLSTKLQMADFKKIQWYHHSLMLDEKGEKLSKSSGMHAFSPILGHGISKSMVLQKIAALLGLPPNPYEKLPDLLENWNFEKTKP